MRPMVHKAGRNGLRIRCGFERGDLLCGTCSPSNKHKSDSKQPRMVGCKPFGTPMPAMEDCMSQSSWQMMIESAVRRRRRRSMNGGTHQRFGDYHFTQQCNMGRATASWQLMACAGFKTNLPPSGSQPALRRRHDFKTVQQLASNCA